MEALSAGSEKGQELKEVLCDMFGLGPASIKSIALEFRADKVYIAHLELWREKPPESIIVKED